MGLRVKLYYRLTTRDGAGRALRRSRRRLSRSFVQQYIQSLWVIMGSFNLGGVIDTGGAGQVIISATTAKLVVNAGDALGTYGPVVGTGTALVAITDNALAGPIPQGSGPGQLEHEATLFSAVSVGPSEASFTITRVFTNLSGASITINEVGIVFMHSASGGIPRYFLGVRDLVPGGQAVPDGGAATLEYTMRITV